MPQVLINVLNRITSSKAATSFFSYLRKELNIPSNVNTFARLSTWLQRQPKDAARNASKLIAKSAVATLAVNEASDIIDAYVVDESSANKGDMTAAVDFIGGVMSLATPAIQEMLQKAYPGLPKVVDDPGFDNKVSANDLVAFSQQRQAADAYIARFNGQSRSNSVNELIPVLRDLRFLSRKLGMNVKDAIKLALIIKSIDVSYQDLPDEFFNEIFIG